MLRLFLQSSARLAWLGFRAVFPGRGRPRSSLRRVLVMLLFVPLFGVVQLAHWVGFLLDELLFPGYRRIRIREPVMVLGVPRSGTTHLHRVLAQDPQFTTFSTWECLFALSITARRFWLGVARLDRALGRPLGRLLSRLEQRLFASLDEVHSMRLSDPEEDYFALMPVLACFILALPFPHSEFVWRMGTFDRDMPDADRKRLMDYYERCLQKHLYVHGPSKRLLSKNAAFAPLAGALLERFPDGRFVLCLREPLKTLPSQLSSIESGIGLFDSTSQVPDLRDRMIQQLGYYYRNLARVFERAPEAQCVWVTMGTLRRDLRETVQGIYARLALDLSAAFQDRLTAQALHAADYRSGHSYRLEQYGLSQEQIDRELGDLYARLAERAIRPPGHLPRSSPAGPPPAMQPTSTREPAQPC